MKKGPVPTPSKKLRAHTRRHRKILGLRLSLSFRRRTGRWRQRPQKCGTGVSSGSRRRGRGDVSWGLSLRGCSREMKLELQQLGGHLSDKCFAGAVVIPRPPSRRPPPLLTPPPPPALTLPPPPPPSPYPPLRPATAAAAAAGAATASLTPGARRLVRQEDKSFYLLHSFAAAPSFGAAACPKRRITWPSQQSIVADESYTTALSAGEVSRACCLCSF